MNLLKSFISFGSPASDALTNSFPYWFYSCEPFILFILSQVDICGFYEISGILFHSKLAFRARNSLLIDAKNMEEILAVMSN